MSSCQDWCYSVCSFSFSPSSPSVQFRIILFPFNSCNSHRLVFSVTTTLLHPFLLSIHWNASWWKQGESFRSLPTCHRQNNELNQTQNVASSLLLSFRSHWWDWRITVMYSATGWTDHMRKRLRIVLCSGCIPESVLHKYTGQNELRSGFAKGPFRCRQLHSGIDPGRCLCGTARSVQL